VLPDQTGRKHERKKNHQDIGNHGRFYIGNDHYCHHICELVMTQRVRYGIDKKYPGLYWKSTGQIILTVMLFAFMLIIATGCGALQNQVSFEYPEVGFTLQLPDSWRGFRVESASWEGLANPPDSDTGDGVVESGPMVTIHHPNSTAENPRQEIPLLVMTIPQWEAMQAGEWHIGAAPVLPMELGCNSRYVFAVPARYNYAFHEGWEEVEEILTDENINISEPDQP
jgi:hypothetical protein